MADFDPDQYLAQKTGGGGFDPDAYLAQKTGQSGAQVYPQPVGPEQDSAIDRFKEKVSDPQRWKAIANNSGPYANKDLVQGETPLAAPIGQVGKLGKLAEFLAESGPKRVATAAAHGAITNPDSPISSGLKEGAIALGGEGVAKGLEAGGKLASFFGGKLGGLTKAESTAVAANPKAAESLAETNRSDPQGLTRMLQDKLRGVRGTGGREGGALSDVFENVVAPEREKLIQKGIGRGASINRSDFKGTAVEPELDRIAKLENPQSKQVDVPVEPAPDSTDPSFTDKNNEVMTGKPDKQVSYTSRPIPPATETPASSTPFQDQLNKYQPILHESAAPETVSYTEKGLPPPPDYKGVQRVNMPLDTPDRININATQLDRLKRMAQDAAFEESRARGMSPVANKAGDELEGAAASKLQAAQRGIVPELQKPTKVRTEEGVKEAPPVLARLEEAANYANHAKSMKNMGQLLNTSEGAGALPARSMRQFLDEASKGRSGLETMAQGLSGGKKLTDPSSGVWDFLKKGAARGLFRVPTSTQGTEDMLKSPGVRSMFLKALQDDKK